MSSDQQQAIPPHKRAHLLQVGNRLLEQHQYVRHNTLREEAGIRNQDYWMVVAICEEMNWPKRPVMERVHD